MAIGTIKKIFRLPFDVVNNRWKFTKKVEFDDDLILENNEEIRNDTDGTISLIDSGTSQTLNIKLDGTSTISIDAPASILSLNPTGVNAGFFANTVGNPLFQVVGQGAASTAITFGIRVGAVGVDSDVDFTLTGGSGGTYKLTTDNGTITLDGDSLTLDGGAIINSVASDQINISDGTATRGYLKFSSAGMGLGTSIGSLFLEPLSAFDVVCFGFSLLSATNKAFKVAGDNAASNDNTYVSIVAGQSGVDNDIDITANPGDGGNFIFHMDDGQCVKTGSSGTWFCMSDSGSTDPSGVVTAPRGAMNIHDAGGGIVHIAIQVDSPTGTNWKHVITT